MGEIITVLVRDCPAIENEDLKVSHGSEILFCEVCSYIGSKACSRRVKNGLYGNTLKTKKEVILAIPPPIKMGGLLARRL